VIHIPLHESNSNRLMGCHPVKILIRYRILVFLNSILTTELIEKIERCIGEIDYSEFVSYEKTKDTIIQKF